LCLGSSPRTAAAEVGSVHCRRRRRSSGTFRGDLPVILDWFSRDYAHARVNARQTLTGAIGDAGANHPDRSTW
jgi:hypothetical protein